MRLSYSQWPFCFHNWLILWCFKRLIKTDKPGTKHNLRINIIKTQQMTCKARHNKKMFIFLYTCISWFPHVDFICVLFCLGYFDQYCLNCSHKANESFRLMITQSRCSCWRHINLYKIFLYFPTQQAFVGVIIQPLTE